MENYSKGDIVILSNRRRGYPEIAIISQVTEKLLTCILATKFPKYIYLIDTKNTYECNLHGGVLTVFPESALQVGMSEISGRIGTLDASEVDKILNNATHSAAQPEVSNSADNILSKNRQLLKSMSTVEFNSPMWREMFIQLSPSIQQGLVSNVQTLTSIMVDKPRFVLEESCTVTSNRIDNTASDVNKVKKRKGKKSMIPFDAIAQDYLAGVRGKELITKYNIPEGSYSYVLKKVKSKIVAQANKSSATETASASEVSIESRVERTSDKEEKINESNKKQLNQGKTQKQIPAGYRKLTKEEFVRLMVRAREQY